MRGPLPQTFTKLVTEVFGEDKVISVHHNRNGEPIRGWYKDWTMPADAKTTNVKPPELGTQYDILMAKVNQAIQGQSLATVTLLWMQGETDGSNGWGSVYEASFLGLLEQFKKDLGVSHISFVVGRINDNWVPPDHRDGEIVRDIQKKLGETCKNGDWVNTDDLNRGVNPWAGYMFDDGHFPNMGYVVLGQRFARKAIKLIDPGRKLDERLFEEWFIDTVDDFKTHAAIHKTITGTPPDDGKGELGLLLDGKYGSTTPDYSHWVAFGEETKTVELIVDLGETMEVNQVAVNLLLNSDASATVPDELTFLVSEDGNEFHPFRKGNIIFFSIRAHIRAAIAKANDKQAVLVLVESGKEERAVRYVKVCLKKNKGQVMLDEIVVNPKQ